MKTNLEYYSKYYIRFQIRFLRRYTREKFRRGNENLENKPRARPKSILNRTKLNRKAKWIHQQISAELDE